MVLSAAALPVVEGGIGKLQLVPGIPADLWGAQPAVSWQHVLATNHSIPTVIS